MRIGIFGGTFDPVHTAHLIIADQAREQARLDQVWFIPSARPPHKLEKPITPFDRRANMLQLALMGQNHFRVELIEKERPGPSYTVDTLADLKRSQPDHEYFLIMGADCLPDFHLWREPARIIEMAALLVVDRPGSPTWNAEQLAGSIAPGEAKPIRMEKVEVPLMDISSRDLRKRASEKRSLAYLVPRAVEVFIREKKVYG